MKNKIRELRGERGWSQAVLADKLEAGEATEAEMALLAVVAAA